MRVSTRSKRTLGAASFCAVLAFSAAAAADGVALDRFNPSMAGDRMFGVDSPYSNGNGTVHLALLGEYAHNPLTLVHGPGQTDVGSLVEDQVFLHANLSIALLDRVTFNVDLPLALIQYGQDAVLAGGDYANFHGTQFGDLRLGVRGSLYGEYDSPLQVGVAGYLWAPHDDAGWVSDGQWRGMPELILGGQLGARKRAVWSFIFGPEFRKKQTIQNYEFGTQLHFGAGLGVLLGDERNVQLGPELKISVLPDHATNRTTNAELLLDAKYRFGEDKDWEIGAGVGPGLTSGPGTPDVRLVGMVAYTPEFKRPVPDRDGDGVPDATDQCPDTPAKASENPERPGCPAPADRDKDGVTDDKDACPDTPGVANPDPTKNGCPSDRDGDHVIDALDACPDVPGVESTDPKRNGCPLPKDTDGDGITDDVDACPTVKGKPNVLANMNGCPVDTDGDGITDDKDACPNEKGPPNADPKKNGCPQSVRVEGNQIVILQQVEFDTGTDKIKSESDALLDQVAGVLKEHPELTKLEVQGHTDDKGAKGLNKTLSQKRADAVRKALIARGVDAGRLTAKGYGQEQPIADNKTEEGRAKNRRVQFVIQERKAQ